MGDDSSVSNLSTSCSAGSPWGLSGGDAHVRQSFPKWKDPLHHPGYNTQRIQYTYYIVVGVGDVSYSRAM